MASPSGSGMAVACLLLVILCLVAPTLQNTVFTVGEEKGWIPGVDYNAWAKTKNVRVGDSLVFDYPGGISVNEVFENDYKTCTTDHPISSDKSGSTTIPVLTAGPHYFICGVASLCAQGMKLVVDVKAAPTQLPPARTTSPSTTAASSSPPASN